MFFYVAGAQDQRFYLLTRPDNVMFSAGNFFRKDHFKNGSRVRHIAKKRVFLDSGGWQFFNRFRNYPFSVEQYVDFTNSFQPDFFATMDIPCEPDVTKKNKRTIKGNIDETIENTIKILDLKPESTLVPVIQGWNVEDYLYCIDEMKKQGLMKPYVAVGTLCRRGNVSKILEILRVIRKNIPFYVRLHGFGVKISSLKKPEIYNLLYSCDSAAWVSRVAHGEIILFTGKRLLYLKYKRLNLDGLERLSISVHNYLLYVEYLIKKYNGQEILEVKD